ncbi:MAG: thioredoxin domain-containing protein [bacterium]
MSTTNSGHKKLYLILVIVIGIILFLLIKEVKLTSSITVKKTYTPVVSSVSFNISLDASDPIYGNPGAPITAVEFIDFDCKKCLELHNTLVDFVKANPTKMRIIWKSIVMPKIISDPYTIQHQAAFCAHDQGKFWQFISSTIQSRKYTAIDEMKKTAQSLNLDTARWWACVNSTDSLERLASSTIAARQLDIRSVPTLFINNKWVNLQEEIKLTDVLKQFVEE